MTPAESHSAEPAVSVPPDQAPESPPPESRWVRRPAAVAAGILSLLPVLVLLVPWDPKPLTASLGGPGEGPATWSVDTSFTAGLHQCFAMREDFGALPCTVGPWGFLYGGYHPATYPWQVAAWSFLAFAFWLGCHHCLSCLGNGPAAAWARAASVVFLVLLACAADSPDVRLFALIALLITGYFFSPVDDQSETRRGAVAATLVLTAAVALAGLIKFSFFAAGLGTILLITLDECARRRTWPKHLVAYAAAVVGFWLVARQPARSLVPFLRNSLVVAGGYRAMAVSLPGEAAELLPFLLAALFVFTRAARSAWLRRGRGGLPAALAVGLFLLLLLRTGHVRGDLAHHVQASFPLLFLAVLLSVPFRRQEAGAWRAIAALTVGGAAALAWADSVPLNDCGLPLALCRAAASVGPNARGMARALCGSDFVRRRYDRDMESVRAARLLPPSDGTVDVYPTDVLAVLANRLRWRPRPVFQSYIAYTPALAALNAEHLRGPEAPDRVLFSVQPVDDRFAPLEDGPSWPELWSRYEVDRLLDDRVWLRRSPRPRSYTITPLGDVTTTFDTHVAVPGANGGAAVWASIEIKPSAVGRVADALLKSPPPYLRIYLADGSAVVGRVPGEMGKAGFLLSPLIGDAAAFAAFQSPGWRQRLGGQVVTELVLETQSPGDAGLYYDPQVVIHFSAIDFPRSQGAVGTPSAR